MRLHIFIIFCISIFSIPTICFSQFESITVPNDSSSAHIEIIGYNSSNYRSPFWIQANQFGSVPKINPAGSVRVGFQKFMDLSAKEGESKWKVGIGVDAVANIAQPSKFVLPQIHATIKYKNWEFFVGRKKQWVGLADSTIGTGSYAWSGNALPIPKVQIGTTRFVNVPFTNGWISFQAFYSDGLFERGRPVTSGLKLHQKALYGRLGKPDSKVKLYGGFNHQVQWGGNSPYLTAPSGNMPDGIRNYFNVVTGATGAHGKDATHFDLTNRVGNHLGSLDLGMEIETYGATLFLYRQTLYEDGSLFYLRGMLDGLNGIRIKRKNSYSSDFEITEGVFEILYTKDQGGDLFVIGNGNQRGIDNYFNNQQVRDGWSYFDRTIGTPFIPPSSETKWAFPVYADNFTSNNRVMVLHAGLKGNVLQTINWFTKLSYSSNAGAYLAPFAGSPNQFSGIIAAETTLNVLGGVIARGSFAADIGNLYEKNYGFSLGLRKNFSLE